MTDIIIPTKEYIERYQMLYKNRFKTNITYQDAYDQLLRLVMLVKETYKPMTQNELDEVMEDKKRIRNKKRNAKKERK